MKFYYVNRYSWLSAIGVVVWIYSIICVSLVEQEVDWVVWRTDMRVGSLPMAYPNASKGIPFMTWLLE